MTSQLEAAFAHWWRIFHAPDAGDPETQYQFAMPERKWAADFAWIGARLILEIQGGALQNGRHNRRLREDYEKGNWAVLHGWRVLYVTGEMLNEDPIGIVNVVCTALGCQITDLE